MALMIREEFIALRKVALELVDKNEEALLTKILKKMLFPTDVKQEFSKQILQTPHFKIFSVNLLEYKLSDQDQSIICNYTEFLAKLERKINERMNVSFPDCKIVSKICNIEIGSLISYDIVFKFT